MIELDDTAEFYTKCPDCGKLHEAADEVMDDFPGYLHGFNKLYCKECSAKMRNIYQTH